MKEFVLCLCLLFSQYPKSEINIYSDYYYKSDIPDLAPLVVMRPSEDSINFMYKAFEELYTPLSYAVKYEAPIQPFDRAVYDSLNILFEKKYENFDFFKEDAWTLFLECDSGCKACKKSKLPCINEKTQAHLIFRSEQIESIKKTVNEMKQTGNNLGKVDDYSYIRKENDVFYYYSDNTPLLYYYEKARKEYREIFLEISKNPFLEN